MSDSVGPIRSGGLVDRAQGQAGAGRQWQLGLIADADPEMDLADAELRRRELRWPVLISIGVIVLLSAGLWLAILAVLARLTHAS